MSKTFVWLLLKMIDSILFSSLGFKCNKCHRAFSSMSSLHSHERIHSGDEIQPFRHKCNLCPYSTNITTHLKNHALVHSGEKPYRCELCNRGFRQPNDLKIHFMRHTGEKPYTCTVCNLPFRHVSSLKKHMSKHSQLLPYNLNEVWKEVLTFNKYFRQNKLIFCRISAVNHIQLKYYVLSSKL